MFIFYFSIAIVSGAITGTVGPIFRSILSQTVGPDEQGWAFLSAIFCDISLNLSVLHDKDHPLRNSNLIIYYTF